MKIQLMKSTSFDMSLEVKIECLRKICWIRPTFSYSERVGDRVKILGCLANAPVGSYFIIQVSLYHSHAGTLHATVA